MADELCDELNRLASSTSVAAGTLLFRRDEPSRSVYVVRSGNIALLWPDGEETAPMEVLGPGSIIGLPAAINGSYSVTAKAAINSELGVISADRVLETLARSRSLPDSHEDDEPGSRQDAILDRGTLRLHCLRVAKAGPL